MKILFKTSADHVYKSGLNRASYIMTMGTGDSTNQKNQNKSNIKYKKGGNSSQTIRKVTNRNCY